MTPEHRASDEPSLRIAGVCERDVDLLFTEEFIASQAFCRWFVSTIGFPAQRYVCVSAHRSVTQSSGESDLEITFLDEQGTSLRVLVENKIAAGFQPLQAERYRARAEAYVRRGECDRAVTVLVAPNYFLGARSAARAFDAQLAYERIIEYFHQHRDDPRFGYKAQLLEAAVAKARVGYTPIADRPVSEFWHSYWEAASRYAPELEMPEPTDKPSGSYFVYFRPSPIPNNVAICHKLPHGRVDLQFGGMGTKLQELRDLFVSQLRSGMSVARAAKSGSIRIATPPVQTTQSFADQQESVIAGLDAARTLLAWFVENAVIWSTYVSR